MTGFAVPWPRCRFPGRRTAGWYWPWTVSPWLRPDANTCPDRSFCHTFGRGEGKHQMVPGWPYSIVAALETGRTSWTAVLDAVRPEPGADVAAVQIREVIERLVEARQWKSGDPNLLVVLDTGYAHPASLTCSQTCRRDAPAHTAPPARPHRPTAQARSRARLRRPRHLATDLRRPWEKPTPPNKLTPVRLRRGFRNLRVKAGSPAGAPKPSRPGPGRPPGSKIRGPATSHDVGRFLTTGEAHSRPAHHKVGTKPRRTG
ncbi:transposase [Streptomyces spiralis]